MTKTRFLKRTAGILAVLALGSCARDSTGPEAVRSGRFYFAPVFDVRAVQLVPFDSVRVHLSHFDGSPALDTTIFFPANVDTVTLDLTVPLAAISQQFLLSLSMIDSTGAIVFHAGPDTVVASAGSNPPPVHPPLIYVGHGSNAAGVRFIGTPPSAAFFGDTLPYSAEAFDSLGVTIPNTPIFYSSSDTLKARVLNKGAGPIVAGSQRGSVTITAALLTPKPSITHGLAIQSRPAALVVQGGNSQTGAAGSSLSPLVARVNGTDGLGVQGVPVSFAVTSGGGSLSKLVDTTDLNGDARTTWTMGTSIGAQSVSATAAGLAPATVSFGATAIAAAAKKLAFTVPPSSVAPGASITPPVRVTAQDTFGNTASGFTGNVTVALGANPGSATLSGTLTVAAVAGVATFNNLSLNNADTGYTLVATATGLTGANSGIFNVSGATPASLFISTQPTTTTAAATMAQIQVQVRDALNNIVASDTANITVAIANNPGGGTLSGTTTVKAVAGVATFNGLSIDRAGTGYSLSFTRAGPPSVPAATSNSFDINSGPATVLQFGVQPPAGANFQTPFTVAVKATDAGGNLDPSFNGNVTITIGTNPASGTLFGTQTVAASGGIATFSTLDIDNIGAGYTLTAHGGTLSVGTSNFFNVVAPAGVNAWINTAGGAWGTASNWSKGTVPTATDTVAIAQSGNYTVNLDVSAAPVALGVGAPIGNQVLSVAANVLTLSTNNVFTTHGKLSLSGGTLTGSGALTLLNGMDWSGGNLTFVGGISVTGGALTISGSGNPTWTGAAIVASGNTVWTGNAVYSSGNGASLTILTGGTLDVQGNASVNVNQGGTTSLNVLNGASVTRSTSTLAFNFGGVVSNAGSISVTSGTLALSGGGGSTGSYNVAAGTRLDFGGQTQALSGPVSSAGQVTVTAGTVNATSNWSGTGSLVVQGGTMALLGPAMSIDTLQETSGSIGGSVGGVMTVNKSFSWTGGNLAGSGGGSGAIIQVTSAASATINLAATATFTNMTLDLSGPTQWLGAGPVNSGQGATIIVEAANTLNLQSNFNLQTTQGGSTLIHNLGTITRTVGVGTAELQVQVDNDGQITVSSGTLRLDGGTGAGTADGVYTATSPGTIEFFGATHSLGSAGTINGNGSILIDGGFVNDAGTLAQTGTTTISSGGFDYNGSNATIPSLVLSGGTLGGSGLLTVLTTFTWSGGNIQGSGGTLHMNASAAATINPSTSATFTNFVIELAGPSSWSGTQTVNTGQGAILRIQNGGTLAIQGDPQFANTQGVPNTQLQILAGGLLTRTTSASTAIMNVEVDNDGQIIASSGTLRLSGGSGAGQSDGSFTATSPGTIEFNGSHTLSNLSTVTGTGTALVSGGTTNAAGSWSVSGAQVAGGNLNYNGAGTGTSTSLSISAGAFGGTGLFTVSGATTWSGGNISGGSGTLRALSGGTLAITTATARSFASHVLEIGGTGTWTGGFVMSSGQTAIMRVLNTGSLALSASADLSLNLGGVSTFDNQGSFTSSAPTANWTAFYQDTAGTTSITSGNFNVNNGADLATGTGKSIGAGATFGQTAGSVRFRQGTTFLGAGKYVMAGGTMSPDSNTAAGALAFTNLDLNAGSLTHEGLVTVSGTMNWNGGNIVSNTTGLGGTTRILGNLNILTTATRTFSGTHLLEMDGTNNTWSGAASPFINTGQGAIMRVKAGATFNVTNTNPTITLNLGGTATFDNLGIVNRNTGTAGFVVNVPITGNGQWNVASPSNLDLQCGGGANVCSMTGATTVGAGGSVLQNQGVVTYSAASSITGGGLIQINNGTFNSQGPVTIGTLTVGSALGGVLNMGGNTISVTGNFATAGIGTFNQQSATNNDSLNVTGNVTFGGGLGTTSAGVIRLLGSWTQTGAANFKGTALSPTVAHRVRFDNGATQQTISFADPTNSFFRRLLMNTPTGSIKLLTDARATLFSSNQSGTGLTGSAGPPITRLFVDTLAGIGGSAVSPLVIQLGGVVGTVGIISDSGTVNVDTIVFAGANQSIRTSGTGGPGTITYKSIRVAQSAGTATFNQATSMTNDLEVSSGTLNNSGLKTHVTGNFRTTGTGVLQMTNANDSLGIGGNASFGGGSTSGTLTAGMIDVHGNFSQSGSTTSFAPSTAQRTFFDLPGSAVIQTISFASPTTSFFDSLVTDRGVGTRGTIQFLTDARINRGWSAQNSTDITGATAHVTVSAPGVFHAPALTTSPTLQLSSLAFGALPSVGFLPGIGINPDTTIYNVGGLIQLTGFTFKSFRASGAVVLAASSTLTLAADLIADGAAGQFSPSGSSVTNVGGRLVTSNGGKLSMVNASDVVNVTGNAIFSGGTSTLTGGTLRLAGTFTEGGGSTSAFQAGAGFVTEFNNTAQRTVSMPDFGTGATNSRFGLLRLARSGGPASIKLSTSIQAAMLVDTSLSVADTITGSTGIGVTADSTGNSGNGLGLDNTVFNGATLTLSSGSGPQSLVTVQFRNMDPTATFLTMFRNGSTNVNISGMNFASAHTTGHYFAGNTVGAGIGPGAFTFLTGSLPASFTAAAGDYTRAGPTLPNVSWNNVTNP